MVYQKKPPPTSMPASALACSQHVNNVMVSPPPATFSDPDPVATEPPATKPGVQKVVAVFDKVISLCNASLTTGEMPGNCQPVNCQPVHRQPCLPHSQQGSEPLTCRVCVSRDNSTHAHCRLYRLCLNCFGPGHTKHDCLQASHSPAKPPLSPSNADLN